MSEPKDESESESKEDQNNPDSEVKNEMEKKDTGNNSADEKDENNEVSLKKVEFIIIRLFQSEQNYYE